MSRGNDIPPKNANQTPAPTKTRPTQTQLKSNSQISNPNNQRTQTQQATLTKPRNKQQPTTTKQRLLKKPTEGVTSKVGWGQTARKQDTVTPNIISTTRTTRTARTYRQRQGENTLQERKKKDSNERRPAQPIRDCSSSPQCGEPNRRLPRRQNAFGTGRR